MSESSISRSIGVGTATVPAASIPPGDSGTIDQNIQAAKFLALSFENRRNLLFVRYIGLAHLRVRQGLL